MKHGVGRGRGAEPARLLPLPNHTCPHSWGVLAGPSSQIVYSQPCFAQQHLFRRAPSASRPGAKRLRLQIDCRGNTDLRSPEQLSPQVVALTPAPCCAGHAALACPFAGHLVGAHAERFPGHTRVCAASVWTRLKRSIARTLLHAGSRRAFVASALDVSHVAASATRYTGLQTGEGLVPWHSSQPQHVCPPAMPLLLTLCAGSRAQHGGCGAPPAQCAGEPRGCSSRSAAA